MRWSPERLLTLRLRAEFRGESFGEAPALCDGRRESPRGSVCRRTRRDRFRQQAKLVRWAGRRDPGQGDPVSLAQRRHALRADYAFGVDLCHGRPIRADRSVPIHFVFPIAIAYGFLPLTRQFCNSLGTEGAGIQLYFLSPTSFRIVMLAKNLLQIGLFCLELVLVATLAVFRFGAPPPTLADCDFLLGALCAAGKSGCGEYPVDYPGLPDDAHPAFARAGFGGKWAAELADSAAHLSGRSRGVCAVGL